MQQEIDLTPRNTHPWVAAGLNQIRFGVSIYPQPPDWRHFIRLVQRMEAQGIDAYWAYDHPSANADCWTALAALAASTSTIRLGTAVDCIYYRSPYLLARQAADIDCLSGGRLVLGIGAGHVEAEFREMGLSYPSLAVRQRGLVETVAILRGLWSGQPFSFHGEQWRVDSPGTFLPPVQQPRIPLLIAGGGEQVTLRQVARYADASNMGAHSSIGSAMTASDLERKFAVLRGYCEAAGREYDSILRSQFTMPLILAPTEALLETKMARLVEQYGQDKIDWCGAALFAGTPAAAIAYYQQLAASGFQYFIANILEGDEETIELLGTAVQSAFRATD